MIDKLNFKFWKKIFLKLRKLIPFNKKSMKNYTAIEI